jgi:hypothetical protein
MPPDPAKTLSPRDWAAIRAAYETGAERIYDIGKRFEVFHLTLCQHAKKHGWVRREIEPPEHDPHAHPLGSVPPSPLMGEGRGGGDLATEFVPEVTPTSRGNFDICEEQISSRVVLPPQGGGGEKLEGGADKKLKPPPKSNRPGRPKQQGMIDRLYRVIDNNLSQLEDIMRHQSDPSIADNEKETRTIGTVIGNIEKLKGLEDDAGKSRANKSAAPTNHAAETERLGRELAERLSRLAKDLRA